MIETYIEQHNAGYWIKETRVSLDSVVYRWLEGLSPESITECFPTLTLEQVYGAIAYYLSHRAEIDAYLQKSMSHITASPNTTHTLCTRAARSASSDRARRAMSRI